ncbi:MAG TPA: 30S ribosomal protein S24e [Thermoplasmata archaeon]|nr:30S ribosomal protein S24e [Thermoplasmata archaeon]
MEIEFLKTKQNEPLDGTEIKFKATHPGEPTASRDAIREKIAALAHSTKEKVVLDNMKSEFGLCQTKGYAKVYKSVEMAKKHESKHILVRNKLIEKEVRKDSPAAATKPAAAPKTAAAPAAAAPAPAPAAPKK